jgi:hypothetical protein
VVVIATTLGVGAWSTMAVASPATSVSSTHPIDEVVVVVEDAPVCPAEQIEAADAVPATDGATAVSFTLVDPRCES